MNEATALLAQAIEALRPLDAVKTELQRLLEQDPEPLETHDALIHVCKSIISMQAAVDEIARYAKVDIDELARDLQAAAAADSVLDQNLQLRTVVTWATLWPQVCELGASASIDPSELEVANQVTDRMLSYATCLLGCQSTADEIATASQTMRELGGD